MAMNLLNPIQLLRGTSAAIAAAQGKEGTLYYDTDRGTLQVRGYDKLYAVPRLQEDILQSFVIHVNASAGSDSNSGYTQDKPLRTLNRALEIVQGICGIRRPIIRMYAGEYTWDDACAGIDTSIAFEGAESGVTLVIDGLGIYGAHVSFANMNIDMSKPIACQGALVIYDGVTVKLTASAYQNVPIQSYWSSAVAINNTTIDGNDKTIDSLFIADGSSNIIFTGNNIVKNITCNMAVVTIINNSHIYTLYAIQNGGNVIGRRYRLQNGAVMNTSGIGPNAIPGTQDGTVDNTSVFA